jgi:hypothetical protein
VLPGPLLFEGGTGNNWRGLVPRTMQAICAIIFLMSLVASSTELFSTICSLPHHYHHLLPPVPLVNHPKPPLFVHLICSNNSDSRCSPFWRRSRPSLQHCQWVGRKLGRIRRSFCGSFSSEHRPLPSEEHLEVNTTVRNIQWQPYQAAMRPRDVM